MKSWKKRTLQASLLAVIGTMTLGAVSASAADKSSEAQPVATAAPAPAGLQTVTWTSIKDASGSATVSAAPAATIAFRAGGFSVLSQPALERSYWKLLAATYAPETAADWKKALDDRKQVEAQLPKTATFTKAIPAPLLKEGSNIEGQALDDTVTLTPAPESPDSAEAKPVDSLPILSPLPIAEGVTIVTRAIPADEASSLTQALPVEGLPADVIMKAEPSEEAIRLQKLAEAVDADDATAIQSLLPQLLQDYIKQTDELRSMVKHLQSEKPADNE
ncbi:hypothetical protein [Paenibacillus whitsoniae]|uniref:Uncharacterized protein n=1 Tax=Paenibacillus whitsoniae TaxID=2496558 RepID=A0A430JEK1_9BACL|nr:hypothetical protein [Paenibacillus whitsoniae]RTE09463.1 hypothetical protein EJQ19_12395 [Paenibacillus whitsoniae]